MDGISTTRQQGKYRRVLLKLRSGSINILWPQLNRMVPVIASVIVVYWVGELLNEKRKRRCNEILSVDVAALP